MNFGKNQKPTICVVMPASQVQTIDLLALANTCSRSKQVRSLIKVDFREINEAIEVIVGNIWADWIGDSSSGKHWEQFKKTANNWLHGKQINQADSKAILRKLQEKYEAHYNND